MSMRIFTIDEPFLHDRLQLPPNANLDEVKNISLPGTYNEKIGCLGNALSRFTRLRHLDVSRNSISSLSAISHLIHLESLNLYYNNISSLQEISLLRHNQHLKDLDLRLNPVTKNEPDYRLFVIHMLPALTSLDDRPVRDEERRAAILHFTTSQSSEFTYNFRPTSIQSDAAKHPRVALVDRLTRSTQENELKTAQSHKAIKIAEFEFSTYNKEELNKQVHREELMLQDNTNTSVAAPYDPITITGNSAFTPNPQEYLKSVNDTLQASLQYDDDDNRDERLLKSVCSIVDKYWNGTNSLNNHPKFVAAFHKLITNHVKSCSTSVDSDSLEVAALKRKLEIVRSEAAADVQRANEAANTALTLAEDLKNQLQLCKQNGNKNLTNANNEQI